MEVLDREQDIRVSNLGDRTTGGPAGHPEALLVRCLIDQRVRQIFVPEDSTAEAPDFTAATGVYHDLAQIFPDAELAVGLPVAAVMAAHGPVRAAVAAEAAQLAPQAFILVVQETAIADHGAPALAALARYRDRGFGLALACTQEFLLPYAAPARALFDEIRVPTRAIRAAIDQPGDVWSCRATRRIAAGRGAGARLVAVGSDAPQGAAGLGFSRWQCDRSTADGSGDLHPATIGDVARALRAHCV
jgi:hypothetical protein